MAVHLPNAFETVSKFTILFVLKIIVAPFSVEPKQVLQLSLWQSCGSRTGYPSRLLPLFKGKLCNLPYSREKVALHTIFQMRVSIAPTSLAMQLPKYFNKYNFKKEYKKHQVHAGNFFGYVFQLPELHP
jgi:hypothetical protein